jgi:hypothetical protein
MTKEKTNEPASGEINITEIPMPMYHEDLMKLEVPKDDVRLTSSDAEAIKKISDYLTADALRKYAQLKKIASDIDGSHEKWKFWSQAKKDYKINIHSSQSYQSASGEVSMLNPGQGQWLDALIDIELADYREQMRVETELSASSGNSDDTMKGVKELLLLHELGVIEFLCKRLGTHSPSKLSHIFLNFMNMKEDNAKKILQRLGDKEKENYKPEQYTNARQTIRERYGEMKPLHLIRFDPKEE